jgi:hypothetical protein
MSSRQWALAAAKEKLAEKRKLESEAAKQMKRAPPKLPTTAITKKAAPLLGKGEDLVGQVEKVYVHYSLWVPSSVLLSFCPLYQRQQTASCRKRKQATRKDNNRAVKFVSGSPDQAGPLDDAGTKYHTIPKKSGRIPKSPLKPLSPQSEDDIFDQPTPPEDRSRQKMGKAASIKPLVLANTASAPTVRWRCITVIRVVLHYGNVTGSFALR